jgi:hypothetical protein
MTYKIVKNSIGEIVAYGKDNGMYEPSLKKGDILTVEDDDVAEPLIEALQTKLAADRIANETAKATVKLQLLERLGITAEEARLLFS